jgi:hypothetical protein
MNITNINVGDYATGYKIWEFTAGDYVCTEDVEILRSVFNTEGDATSTITLNVVGVDCSMEPHCNYDEKYLNDAGCGCVAVDTTHSPAASTVIVVGAKMGETEYRYQMSEGEMFTLRDFNHHGDGLEFTFDQIQDTLNDCVSVVNDTMYWPFENEEYIQITLNITKEDCMWVFNST